MTDDADNGLALRGWSAACGAAILVVAELSLIVAATASAASLGDYLSPYQRGLSAMLLTFALCLVGFSFAVSKRPAEFVLRTVAIALLVLPTVLLAMHAARTAGVYTMLLLVHVSLALWFLDEHLPSTTSTKRAVLLFYGGAWVALTIDAIGRYTSLGFAKDIPLHPALGAFNDFRVLIAGGILAFWLIGAFLATVWDQKAWVVPLANPFAAAPTSGRWGGVRDGLEWLAHQGFVAVDIGWRGLANAFVLLKCYAGHLTRDYIRPVFDKGYLTPVIRFMLSVVLIGGVTLGAVNVGTVLGDYLRRPSGIAESLLGPLQRGGLHGHVASELLSIGEVALFILCVACCIVFEAWNWRVGGKTPDVIRRIVIVLGIVVVSFAVTGVLGTILAWSEVGLVGPGFRYGGLVSAIAMTAVALFVLGVMVSRRGRIEGTSS
jgi:hypothetical protein